MNILAIGAHFDDIELGCGGTLAKHVANGDHVLAFVATKSGYSNPNNKIIRPNQIAYKEGLAGMEILGVRLICGGFRTFKLEFGEKLNRKILSIIEKEKIDRIYTHWHGDIHHDHQIISKSTLHCGKHVQQILMYRSNWYKAAISFKGNFFVDISNFLNKKEAAIRAHKSEMRRTGRKWLRYFKNEAENAGLISGVQYAEAFELTKWTEK